MTSNIPYPMLQPAELTSDQKLLWSPGRALRRGHDTTARLLVACGRHPPCGDERELMHDGCPTACVGDAAFGYVNAYRDHVNVGFFFGALLNDPHRLLEGTGKRGRHVKLRPGAAVDRAALAELVDAAYVDICARLRRIITP